MSLLEYNVTRPVPLSRCWTIIIIIGAVLAIVFVTLSNVIAVGYEFGSFTSTSYDEPSSLWYKKIVPGPLYPSSRTCQGVALTLGEGKTFPEIKVLTIIVISSHNRWTYTLSSYLDGNGESPTDGLPYEGYPLINCSVNLVALTVNLDGS